MKEKFRRFMTGRYGADQLSQFLMIAAVVCMFISLFSRQGIFYWFALALIIYSYFRMFSKNYTKRYQENQRYMKYYSRVQTFLWKKKSELKTRKTHHIYKCPNCRQKIRVPKGKGKIAITCPKCRTEFIKNS